MQLAICQRSHAVLIGKNAMRVPNLLLVTKLLPVEVMLDQAEQAQKFNAEVYKGLDYRAYC